MIYIDSPDKCSFTAEVEGNSITLTSTNVLFLTAYEYDGDPHNLNPIINISTPRNYDLYPPKSESAEIVLQPPYDENVYFFLFEDLSTIIVLDHELNVLQP